LVFMTLFPAIRYIHANAWDVATIGANNYVISFKWNFYLFSVK